MTNVKILSKSLMISHDISVQCDDGRECLKQFRTDSDNQCSFGNSQSRRMFRPISVSLHDVDLYIR